MAEKEQPTTKRGRPRKKQLAEPINENAPSIKMTEEQAPVTFNELEGIWKSVFNNFSTTNMEQVKTNLANLQTYNPFIQNDRLKHINSLPVGITKKQLEDAFKNPQNNERIFRELGWNLSTTTYIYYKMLRLAMDVPLFNSYVYPKYITKKEMGDKAFEEDSVLAHSFLEALNTKVAFKKIAMEVKREGKCSYVYRQSISKDDKHKKVDFALLQKLPSDYIKYTAIGSDTSFVTSFDFMLFFQPGFSVEQYPKFFQDMFEEVQNSGAFQKNKKGKITVDLEKIGKIDGTLERRKDTYLFWKELPQDQVFCFGSDLSNVWQLPDTLGLFGNLTELDDYRWLQGALTSSPLTNIMTAEVEINDDDKVPGYNDTKLSPDVILGFQDLYNTMVSGNSAGFFAPFKDFELHSLPNVPNSMDIYSSALQDTITSAGIAGLLTTESKPSVAMVKTSQLLAEAEADFVTKQLESFANLVLAKHLGLKYTWKCSIWGGIFTISDEISDMQAALTVGISSVLPRYLSAFGLDIQSDNCINDWLSATGTYEKFHQVQSAFQTNGKDTGRPKSDENNIQSDDTEAAINLGENTGDMRD